VDYDDWMLNPMMFAWLDNLWGPHTIDRFASPRNAQIFTSFGLLGRKLLILLHVIGQRTIIGGFHQLI